MLHKLHCLCALGRVPFAVYIRYMLFSGHVWFFRGLVLLPALPGLTVVEMGAFFFDQLMQACLWMLQDFHRRRMLGYRALIRLRYCCSFP